MMVRTKIPQEEFKTIVEKYISGVSLCKLEKEYPTDRKTLKKILMECNVEIRDDSHKGRKYSLNENYFDSIDTEMKAYALGLLYSDGWNSKTNTVGVQLQEGDQSVLELINADMDSNRELIKKHLHNKNENWKDSYLLSITNKHMSEQLNNLGLMPNKNFKLRLPTYLDKEMMRHFLRGYFDGDAHFHIVDGCYWISMGCNKDFCTDLITYVNTMFGFNSKVYPRKDTKAVIWELIGKINVFSFMDYLYRDATIYIPRKHNTYLRLKRIVELSGE